MTAGIHGNVKTFPCDFVPSGFLVAVCSADWTLLCVDVQLSRGHESVQTVSIGHVVPGKCRDIVAVEIQ